MPPPKSENNYAQFSILSLARMCWMHRWAIALVWAAFTAATLVVVYRLPAIYAAEALVLIDAQKIPERFVPTTVSADTEDRLATISQEILSNTRLKKIIDDYDLYHEERKHMPLDEVVQKMRRDISSHLKVERGAANNKPDAFHVGYEGKDPAVVAQVANQLANLFVEENLRTREGQAEGTSEFITMQVADAKKKLDTLETAIREYKAHHNGELPEQQNALQGALNRLQMEQISNRDAIARDEESKASTERTLKMAEDTVTVLLRPPEARDNRDNNTLAAAEAAGVRLPSSLRSKKQSEILQGQLDELSARYGVQHPDVKRLRTEVARAQAAEARAEAEEQAETPAPKTNSAAVSPAPRKTPPTANPAEVGQARERVEALRSQIALFEKDIVSRQADQQRIARELGDYQGKLTNVPMREQELSQITRDYDITKLNYHSLLEKQISAEMSTDMERRQKSERFTIIDPAHVPERPSKPNRPFFITVGSLFGFVLVMVGALGVELRKDRLLGEWELPESMPVLARVPVISMAKSGAWRKGGRGLRGASVVTAVVLAAISAAAARYYLGAGF
jgi:polysaccharide biosynthesis transport protein